MTVSYCITFSIRLIEGCHVFRYLSVHGGWSDWETDGVCDQACGGGYIVRRRYCDNPPPEFEGEHCKGSPNETTPCNQHKCTGMTSC